MPNSQDDYASPSDYHRYPTPGKLEIRATKPTNNSQDLAMAYSPGVAEVCLEIQADPALAASYTAKSNLVAVITNGTAVLGLGNIGPLASKPVMEGKAILFKKFANIDCFDLEVNERDPYKLAQIVASMEPSFGAINLEDIAAPDCFIVEEECQRLMGIPVFHDDQHGTAIVVAAGLTNALRLTDRAIEDIKIVAVGAGAAGVASLKMLLTMGARRENIWLFDRSGLVTVDACRASGGSADPRYLFARSDAVVSLDDVFDGADFFLGLSARNLIGTKHIARMNKAPIIFALANPDPEILPDLVRSVDEDAIVATGRSDFPNQVNNVLCFPFIFRGALDIGATEINDEMKKACVMAIADTARLAVSSEVSSAYAGENFTFGRDYIIPKAFDQRLLSTVPPAVAKAGIESGVATRELDIEAYRAILEQSIFKTSLTMKPIFDAARSAPPMRLIFAEGENYTVLRAVQSIIEIFDDKLILIGRPSVIEARIKRIGLSIRAGHDFDIIDPNKDERYDSYWQNYQSALCRQGVTPGVAKAILRTNNTAIAATAVRIGDADSMICGTLGQYSWHLRYISQVLGTDDCAPIGSASLILSHDEPLFLADTHVNSRPNPVRLGQIAKATASYVRSFGMEPKIAFCSSSQFGDLLTDDADRVRQAIRLLDEEKQDFVYEGEMHTDTALDEKLREKLFPQSRLVGRANALIYASTDAAGAVRSIMRSSYDALEIGPLLMGMKNKAHVVAPSITSRGIVNIAAWAFSRDRE